MKKLPKHYLSKFTLAQSKPVTVPFCMPVKRVRKFALSLKFLALWRQQQVLNVGNRNWGKANTAIYRLLAKQIFYPATYIATPFYQKKNHDFVVYSRQLWREGVPLSSQGFEQFLAQAKEFIEQFSHANKGQLFYSYRRLATFIQYQNKHFILEEHYYPVPAPPVDSAPKENTQSIDENYVTHGKRLVKIIKAVQYHWQTTQDYSNEQILGWLLFSGIVYGGINHADLLQAWLMTLLTTSVHVDEFMVFDDYRLLVHIRYQSSKYGNEFDNDVLFNTQQVLIDWMSLCWLYRYRQVNPHTMKEINIHQLLFTTLQPILNQIGEKITLNWLLKNACYYWEMLPSVDIDQALIGVMQGKHRTTGLTKQDFINYLNHAPQHNKTVAKYDLVTLSQLQIEPKADTTNANVSYKEKVRRSDLIYEIRQIFERVQSKKYRATFIESLNKKPNKNEFILYHLQYFISEDSSLSEQILIHWIMDFVQRQTANYNSILQYLGTVGYEWLYFTNFQPIDSWSEEDFTETYDEILDYKAYVLGNTDIGYTAKRLQNLHQYGETHFGLAKVVIDQAQSRRKVRSQLMSPSVYFTLLEQLRTHVQGLDGMMLIAFFILSYRTGMRKKELLGLEFQDIELLSLPKPSAIIRPNLHRSIKTEGSIRRVPFFAVLTEQELEYVSEFLCLTKPNKLNRQVFIFADTLKAIPDNLPLTLLQKVLADIGVDNNMALHSLRHTTATNLALTLNANEQLTQDLTQLTSEQITHIKAELLGVHDTQDKWYALAYLMGHISPQRTFEYYIHTAMLMATDKITQADIVLPLQTFTNITGFNKIKLKENGYIITDNTVSLKAIRPLLNRLILKKRKAITNSWQTQTIPKTNFSLFTQSPLASNNNPLDSALSQYSVNDVITLLTAVEKAYQLDLDADISQLIANSRIDNNFAQHLIQQAKKIATLTTQKGKPRFVSANNSLVPIEPQLDSEKKLRQTLLLNIRNLQHQGDMSYQYLLALGMDRLSTRQAGLPLSADELDNFLPIAKTLLKAEKWLIKFEESESCVVEILNKHQFTELKKIIQKSARPAKDDPIKKRKKTIICELGIAQRSTTSKKIDWQFSTLLRFIVHYLYLFKVE